VPILSHAISRTEVATSSADRGGRDKPRRMKQARPDASPLDWWSRAAADAHHQISGTPAVRHAQDGGNGPTMVVLARVGSGPKRPVLLVARRDVELHTRQRSGKWIATQAMSTARFPQRQRRSQRFLPSVMLLAAFFTVMTFFIHTDNGSRLLSLVTGVALFGGAATLIRFRRRRTENITWSSDDDATRLLGLTAAIRALHDTEGSIYKTWFHARAERRNSMTRANRRARLSVRAGREQGRAPVARHSWLGFRFAQVTR
jgi:hypothetical protein